MRTTRRAVVMGAVVALVACGGNGDGGGAPATTSKAAEADGQTLPADFDACTLLSTDEAAALLETAVAPPVSEATPTLFVCSYLSDTDPLREIVVAIIEYDSAREATFTFEQTLRRNDYSEIDGLDYRAFEPHGDNDLDIVQGNHEILIAVSYPERDERALAEQIAPMILTRIP